VRRRPPNPRRRHLEVGDTIFWETYTGTKPYRIDRVCQDEAIREPNKDICRRAGCLHLAAYLYRARYKGRFEFFSHGFIVAKRVRVT
jgi:hypothetical protein